MGNSSLFSPPDYYTTVICFPLYFSSGNSVTRCARVVGEEPRIGHAQEQSNSFSSEIHKQYKNQLLCPLQAVG